MGKSERSLFYRVSEDWFACVRNLSEIVVTKQASFFNRICTDFSEALRVYDAFVVRQLGEETKPSQLNLPREWDFLRRKG